MRIQKLSGVGNMFWLHPPKVTTKEYGLANTKGNHTTDGLEQRGQALGMAKGSKTGWQGGEQRMDMPWSGGSTLTNFGPARPLLGPIFFIFMQFSGKFGQKNGCCQSLGSQFTESDKNGIDGSKGRQGHSPPIGGPNPFIFMQLKTKIFFMSC